LHIGRTIKEMAFDGSVDVDSALRSLYRVDVGGVLDVSEIHVCFAQIDSWGGLEHTNAQLTYSLQP
jgi:hypothetical protein